MQIRYRFNAHFSGVPVFIAPLLPMSSLRGKFLPHVNEAAILHLNFIMKSALCKFVIALIINRFQTIIKQVKETD